MSDLISRQAAIEAMSRISDSICEAEAVDALCEVPTIELIRCKDCKYFDPPHVEKDGERHEYNEFPQEAFDLFGIGVTVTYGINVGGRCKYYNLCGYPEDKSVYVPANNYCGRAEPKEKS